MNEAKIINLYDLNETIAADYLKQFEYPWEALGGISDYIVSLSKTLDLSEYDKIGEDIFFFF